MADETKPFFDRHFPAIVTLVVALSGGIFSLVQYHANEGNQKLEKERLKIEAEKIAEQKKSEFKLQIANFVYNGRKEIFSKNTDDKKRMRDVMKATFPFDIYNDVFSEIAKSDPAERVFWIEAKNILAETKSAPGSTHKTVVAIAQIEKMHQLNNNIEKRSIEPDSLKPHVKYEELPKKSTVTGSNLYKFYLTVDAPDPKSIKKVVYRFNHPSWGKDNTEESSTMSNKFEVSYTGWGAINSVDITVNYGDGKTITKNLDMLAALGWQ